MCAIRPATTHAQCSGQVGTTAVEAYVETMELTLAKVHVDRSHQTARVIAPACVGQVAKRVGRVYVATVAYGRAATSMT